MQQCSDKNMPILVGALRSTINRLQEKEDLQPDDPALQEIKSHILRTIARREREMEADEESVA